MADIFLSYASADRERVRVLVDALERQGWSVWWDRRILPGQNWDDLIAGALDQARCVIVLWTRTSVVSDWVRIEANIGRERNILAPVLLDDVAIPLTFRQIQTAALMRWQGDETFPELVALCAGVRAILSGRAAPAVAPTPVSEDRAVDAAIGRELPVDEPANLIAMIRRADSTGLKAILETDDEYGLSGEDVVSKPFELTFPTDAAGRPLPVELLLRVNSPRFEPAFQEKKILVRSQRDSTVCSFLMTPLEPGHLVVQLELYIRDACVASRILRASGIPSGRTVAVAARQVITMPLYVNVSAAELGKLLSPAVAAPGAVPAGAASPSVLPPPPPAASVPTMLPPPPSPIAGAPARRGSSGVWIKAGVAAAVALICVPILRYQLANRNAGSPPMSVQFPSASPPPVTAPPAAGQSGGGPTPNTSQEIPRSETKGPSRQPASQRPVPVMPFPPPAQGQWQRPPEPPKQESPPTRPPAQTQPPPESPKQEPSSAVRPPAQSPAAVPPSAELQAAGERLVLLTGRAAGNAAALAQLKRRMAASGLSLRADVIAAETRTSRYLDSAEETYKQKDVARTTENLDAAERAIELIEKFLNR